MNRFGIPNSSNNTTLKIKDYKTTYKRIGVINDIHIPYHSIKPLEISIEYLLKSGVDCLYINGDFMDCRRISSFRSKPTDIPFSEEIELTKEFISTMRKIFKNIKVKFGNHEYRLETYLLKNATELYDLEVLKLKNLLDIKDDEFVDVYEISKFGHLFILHGHEIKLNSNVVNIARTMYMKVNSNVLFGHFHTTQTYYQNSLNFEVRGAFSVGCLGELSPEYRPFTNWNYGFAIVNLDDNGNFYVENRIILNTDYKII